jgi:hypothetical protein
MRVVIDAEGYVPRVAGYVSVDDEPRWCRLDTELSPPHSVFGRVRDAAGIGLEGVDVRLDVVSPPEGGRYEVTQDLTIKTAADGRFRFDGLPTGGTSVWVSKPGYCRPGLGASVTTPASDLELTMIPSAQLEIRVDFGEKSPPPGYVVHFEPEGGGGPGTYGGSGTINAQHEIQFKDVPPGRYTLRGRPNPGSDSEETGPVTVELEPGQSTQVTLKAK